MEEKQELTGMALFKQLLGKERRGQSMTEEEQEWFEYQKKKSKEFKAILNNDFRRDAGYD